MQTWGTEGDVRPFFALAEELQDRGHTVRVLYTNVEGRDFSELAAQGGIQAASVGADYFRNNQPRIRALVNEVFAANNPFQQARLLIREMLNPVASEMLDAGLELTRESDVMVAHFMSHPTVTAALSMKRPIVSVALAPIFETLEIPPPGAPNMGTVGNWLLWRLASAVLNSALRESVNGLRVRCGLPYRRDLMRYALSDMTLALVCMSPSLLSPSARWPSHLKLTGFLSPKPRATSWMPDADLRAFLDAGDAPLFASFGSMFSLDDVRTMESVSAIVDGCTLAGVRAVIQAPDAIASTFARSPRIFFSKRAPHDQLFPLCSAIVHHGGAGTTQSALIAGRPSVIVPHAADQKFWADTLHARGAATKPPHRRSLTARALAQRITEVCSSVRLRARAATLGEALAKENGARTAAEHIERECVRLCR